VILTNQNVASHKLIVMFEQDCRRTAAEICTSRVVICEKKMLKPERKRKDEALKALGR
jgi:hypothetical protein